METQQGPSPIAEYVKAGAAIQYAEQIESLARNLFVRAIVRDVQRGVPIDEGRCKSIIHSSIQCAKRFYYEWTSGFDLLVSECGTKVAEEGPKPGV